MKFSILALAVVLGAVAALPAPPPTELAAPPPTELAAPPKPLSENDDFQNLKQKNSEFSNFYDTNENFKEFVNNNYLQFHKLWNDPEFKNIYENNKQFQVFYDTNFGFRSFVNNNFRQFQKLWKDSQLQKICGNPQFQQLWNYPQFSYFYETNMEFQSFVNNNSGDVKAIVQQLQDLVNTAPLDMEFGMFGDKNMQSQVTVSEVPSKLYHLAGYPAFMTLWKEQSFGSAYENYQIFRDAVQSQAFKKIVKTGGFEQLVKFPSVLQYILSEQFVDAMEELSQETSHESLEKITALFNGYAFGYIVRTKGFEHLVNFPSALQYILSEQFADAMEVLLNQESFHKIIELFKSQAFDQIMRTNGFEQLVKFPSVMQYILSIQFADYIEELSQDSLEKITALFNGDAFRDIVRTDGFKQLMEVPAFIKLFNYENFRDFIFSEHFILTVLNNPDEIKHFKNYVSSGKFTKDVKENVNLSAAFRHYVQQQQQPEEEKQEY